MAPPGYILERARLTDVDELLKLYFVIYGNTYPLALGTNRKVMESLIGDDRILWFIARFEKSRELVASCVFTCDPEFKIAKVEGVVTHPDHRGQHLASHLLEAGSREVLSDANRFNSVYTTTRTLTVNPQLLFLKNGFHPLGIFPNAHKLSDYETLTLMAKYNQGVLQRRKPIKEAPEFLMSLLEISNHYLKTNENPELLPTQWGVKAEGPELEFEIFWAPAFVQRKFYKNFPKPEDRFYPFHKPNLIMSSTNGEVEIYAHYSKLDGYCTLCAVNVPWSQLVGRVRPLLNQLRDFGVSYLEVLIPVDKTEALQAALQTYFVPSAFYPAMVELNGELLDFVVLSRTLEILDFHGMQVDRSFKPYVDQYVDVWKRMHLEVIGVFDDYH